MESVSLVPCDCPTYIEQTGLPYAIAIDPVKKPNGTPVHESDAQWCTGIWLQNPSSSLTLYFSYGDTKDLAACFRIAPGQDKYFAVINEAEKLVAIPKLRLKPNRWRVTSTAAMTAVALLFL